MTGDGGRAHQTRPPRLSTSPSVPGLLGRRRECETLDRLVQDARAGRSGVLVLRGEAGVGKSALLGHLRERASGCRVADAAGVESEVELAFAGLQQLCAPMLDRLEGLPDPQRDALETAFGLSAGGSPDRFLVGLAVLSLLSEVGEEQPLVCVVDDAQWLDQASAQALAFAARRLLAEPVALVFGVREPAEAREFAGLPQMVVSGLGDDDALALLDSAVRGRLDEQVRDRIVAETRGNPLALLELPRGRTPAELAGGFGLPGAPPLTSRIEKSFEARITALPPDTRRLLVIAAADPVGDAILLWRAAGALGIRREAADAAVEEGLIGLGGRVRFRHPLVRSAAYRAASAAERRRAHGALAEATDPEADPDRRAWHRAEATAGPDEGVAEELLRSAGRAQGRGGVAAAAAFLQRAAELTPDRGRRAARALDAAQAKFDAFAPDDALALLATAEAGPLDELQRARLERLRARVTFARTRGPDAPGLLLDAARRLEPLDGELARETYLEAIGATVFAGHLSGVGVADLAAAARDAPAASEPPRPIDLLLDGLVTRFTEGYPAGVGPLRRALEAFRAQTGSGGDDLRGLWLACRVAPDLWDDEGWHALVTRELRLAHDAGALSPIPVALAYRATVHLYAGEFDAASALIGEADAISEATGNPAVGYTSLVVAAWRGDEARATELIAAEVRDAAARGEGRTIALAEWATAVLHNGLGGYETALAAAGRACAHDHLGLLGWALTEQIEAGVRSGRREAAASALARLEERTTASGTDWALGIAARSRALLSEGAATEPLYREAIERLGRTRMAIHVARTHLLYGEWLRRANRRVDAREHLRTAHEMFRGFGAEAFTERARRELVATGQVVRRHSPQARDELSAQEAQIARLAAAGRTNPQIGAELFLSPRTVEWHLRKVFAKLGVGSRRELRDALPPHRGGPPSRRAPGR